MPKQYLFNNSIYKKPCKSLFHFTKLDKLLKCFHQTFISDKRISKQESDQTFSANFQCGLRKYFGLKLSHLLHSLLSGFKNIKKIMAKKVHGNWQIQSVRAKTFTHSCTYRRRHVAACCKPCEWHLLLWDKARPVLLLGSGYEACFRVGWQAPLAPYLLSAWLGSMKHHALSPPSW